MTPTILCVDDDDQMTGMLYDTLTPRGFNVLVASTVERGADIARSTKVDLIILDLYLPDADGFSLFERLAGDSTAKKIPVVMASGCGTVDARNLASRHGAIAYLQKPFQIQQLVSVIQWAAPAPEPAAT